MTRIYRVCKALVYTEGCQKSSCTICFIPRGRPLMVTFVKVGDPDDRIKSLFDYVLDDTILGLASLLILLADRLMVF